jgi:lipopolysaccharide transport system permease protein
MGVATSPRVTGTAPPRLVIRASERRARIDLRELWAYRGLLWFLVRRDVKIRYAQTVLGAGWAVLQPVLSTLVFTIFLGRLARVPSNGVPYPVFALAGLVPWTYFSAAVSGSSNSLVASSSLITKIYFPRLIIPIAPVLAGLVDLAVASVVLFVVLLVSGIVPTASALVAVPLCVAAAMLTAAGVGCWLSALNVRYRDVKHVLPFVIQIWMFASPVVYSASLIPERYRALYALNPMAGAVEGIRASLLGAGAVPWAGIAASLAIGTLLLVSGAVYFRSAERAFADVA